MPLSAGIDGVTLALARDANLLNFNGLTTASPPDQIAAFLVKSEETDDVVGDQIVPNKEQIPLIKIYKRPGKPDHATKQMYVDKIVIDIFASDSFTARSIADRIFDVLHNAEVSTSSFHISACRFAYDTTFRTGVVGIHGHRLWFDVSYYIG